MSSSRREKAHQYLKRFSQLDAERFAVVKVGGAILRDEIDDLASALAFLQQVGLTPIVVHGAGPQLNEELAPPASSRRFAMACVSRRRKRSPSCVASSTPRT